jgi:hypothetical protein
LSGRDNGGEVTNVQYKPNQNCHYEFTLYKEYVSIKKEEKFREKGGKKEASSHIRTEM